MTVLLDRPPDAGDIADCAGARLRVLNASSGSAASERATAAAAAIAREHDAELVVLHVALPVEVRVTRLGPTVVRTRWAQDAYASPPLLRARRIAWDQGALARVLLLEGEPVSGILVVVQWLRPRLLVIGAQRRRLPVTVAARTRDTLERRADCRVLVAATGQAKRVHDGRMADAVVVGARSC